VSGIVVNDSLVLVPSLYSLVEDVRAWARSLGARAGSAPQREAGARAPT
jgi:hypothetical protein